MAEKHVHKVYGSFPPWGKSVEFSANGGGNYVYYSGTMRDFAVGVTMASIIKANMDGDIEFTPSGVFWSTDANSENIIGAGFDTSMKMTNRDDSSELITVGDVIAEHSKEWTQITEEEFYKIPPQFTLMYGDEPKTFFYDEGMTWEEWIDSSYNDGDFRIEESNLGEGVTSYVEYRGDVVRAEVDYDYGYVKPHRQIQSDIRYWRPVGGPI